MFTPQMLTPGSKRTRLLVMLGLIVLIPLVAVASASTGKLSRCGYINAQSGRNAVYPWHMTCGAAEKIVIGAGAKGSRQIAFTAPGTDGAAVEISGVWWVCSSNVGNYECGYPYRPAQSKGGTGFAGPFTKAVVYQACSTASTSEICARSATFYQPRG